MIASLEADAVGPDEHMSLLVAEISRKNPAALGVFAVRRLRAWRPLAETRHQLGEDCACVREMLLDSKPRLLPPPADGRGS